MRRSPGWRRSFACALAVCVIAAGASRAQGPPDPAEQAVAEQPPAGPPPNSVVEQPRPFGYVIGDVMKQRVLLQIEGQEFEPAVLPRAERISAWLERRAGTIEPAADGRRWLAVEYQLINAPQALATLKIPAWELQPKSGATALRIGEWRFSASPLTRREESGQGGMEQLRPDRPAPMIATASLRRHAAIWSGALGITLVFWLGWVLWRGWRASSTQPFARALREMRRVDDSAPPAWLALHRAFDRTAGQAMQTATLADLFRQAPHLAPLRPQIEQFFRQSGERFFGPGPTAGPLPVRKLCAALRRLEKRHER